MKLFVLWPGKVRSATDGQVHQVQAGRLAALYKVRMEECYVERDTGERRGWPEGVMHLHVRNDGAYEPVTDEDRDRIRRRITAAAGVEERVRRDVERASSEIGRAFQKAVRGIANSQEEPDVYTKVTTESSVVEVNVEGCNPHSGEAYEATATLAAVPRIGDHLTVWLRTPDSRMGQQVAVEVDGVYWPTYATTYAKSGPVDRRPTITLKRPDDLTDDEWETVMDAINTQAAP